MKFAFWVNAALSIASFASSTESSAASPNDIIDDIDVISNYWGQISPYKDNRPDYFGVKNVGLPDGCGLEQAHVLHRYVVRYFTKRALHEPYTLLLKARTAIS